MLAFAPTSQPPNCATHRHALANADDGRGMAHRECGAVKYRPVGQDRVGTNSIGVTSACATPCETETKNSGNLHLPGWGSHLNSVVTWALVVSATIDNKCPRSLYLFPPQGSLSSERGSPRAVSAKINLRPACPKTRITRQHSRRSIGKVHQLLPTRPA